MFKICHTLFCVQVCLPSVVEMFTKMARWNSAAPHSRVIALNCVYEREKVWKEGEGENRRERESVRFYFSDALSKVTSNTHVYTYIHVANVNSAQICNHTFVIIIWTYAYMDTWWIHVYNVYTYVVGCQSCVLISAAATMRWCSATHCWRRTRGWLSCRPCWVAPTPPTTWTASSLSTPTAWRGQPQTCLIFSLAFHSSQFCVHKSCSKL